MNIPIGALILHMNGILFFLLVVRMEQHGIFYGEQQVELQLLVERKKLTLLMQLMFIVNLDGYVRKIMVGDMPGIPAK